MSTPTATWYAGAAEADITPTDSQFLFGYPHVKRYSSGVSDPLLASAMLIGDGDTDVLLIGCDIIWVPRPIVDRARTQIQRLTGLPSTQVMITATHTHSGPITAGLVSTGHDTVVPGPDKNYLERLEQGIVTAAQQAWRNRQPADVSFAVADASALGTNRRDPAGPSLPTAPVLIARKQGSRELIGVTTIVSMHPTVLHEDSTLVSGDFPGLARTWLKANGVNCPFVYHMGASGDQSPRHVVNANTIEEAQRLGGLLGQAITDAMEQAEPLEPVSVGVHHRDVHLPRRELPSVDEAASRLEAARNRLQHLRDTGADRGVVRTAECDWFGAEETLTLAKLDREGKLDETVTDCMPAQVQILRLGNHFLVGWPGEVFVEFALQIRRRHPNAHIITLANGDLQGYLVTQQAVDEQAYEATNAIFASPVGGETLVDTTLRLLDAAVPQEASACVTS